MQGGFPGALLSQLAGSELSLSEMDYNALASGQVNLLGTSELLRTGAGVQAGTFEEVIPSDIALPRLVTSMARSAGNSATAQVLRTLAARLPNRTVRLNSIIDVGPLGSRSVADPARPVREALQIANRTRHRYRAISTSAYRA